MSNQPLRRILTLQSLLAIVMPFGVVTLFGIFWILPQTREDAGDRQLLLARAVGMQVESHLEVGAAIVRAAAAMPFNSRLPLHGYQEHLDTLLNSTESIGGLYTVAPDGRVFSVALKDEMRKHQIDLVNLNLSRNPLFRELSKSEKPLWSETFLSVVTGGLTVAYGVHGNGSTVIGEVDLALLTKFLKQISTEKESFILIVDHNGQVVADNNGRYTAQQLNIGNIPLVRNGLLTDAPTTGRFNFEGQAMTGSIIQIPTLSWHVMVAKTDTSLFRSSRDMILALMAGILIALSSGLITSFYLARRLASRFDEIAAHAREIARGDETGEWPTSAITEFNQLSDSLHTMAAVLRQQECILRDSEENYRCFAELTSDYVYKCYRTAGAPFRIKWVGGSVGAITGYSAEEIYEMGCWLPMVHEDDREAVSVQLAGLTPGDVKQMEFRLVTKQGETLWISEKSRCVAGQEEGELVLFGSSKDISDRKRSEEERLNLQRQMLHAQKLESLGVLAGGIAHDFNNILTAIIGNADLALMRITKESPAVDNLHRIEQAASRAADLAKQMLAYSGKGKFFVDNINLDLLLEEMLHMLEVSISKKAVLRFNLHQPLPAVEADATQMRQIIMNLVINASEAIGEKSGVIAITTGCMECDRTYLKDVWLDENLADGIYVYLEIADTGCGMDKETLAKLFDPFFTTKFTGRGLGMAAVLGIVRGHKGAIKVYSEPGKGTSFKILLPASDRHTDIFNAESYQDDWRGSGTVLLVDDEETIRGIGAEMLEELGFTTITAEDGRDALKVFKETPHIDFVILDLTMPHMDGEQCFRELRLLKPDVKVIMSSGYNEQEVSEKFVGKGLAGFIQKPYKLSVLRDAVRKIQEQGDDDHALSVD